VLINCGIHLYTACFVVSSRAEYRLSLSELYGPAINFIGGHLERPTGAETTLSTQYATRPQTPATSQGVAARKFGMGLIKTRNKGTINPSKSP
jgi:hypothetical protein